MRRFKVVGNLKHKTMLQDESLLLNILSPIHAMVSVLLEVLCTSKVKSKVHIKVLCTVPLCTFTVIHMQYGWPSDIFQTHLLSKQY